MATSLAKNQIPINQLCREIINKNEFEIVNANLGFYSCITTKCMVRNRYFITRVDKLPKKTDSTNGVDQKSNEISQFPMLSRKIRKFTSSGRK